MNSSRTNEISTIYGREKLKVTCIERRYKVEDSKVSFIVNAKKELDEDTTSKLLHEDMELKTFLANYEITDIILQPVEIENVKTIGRDVHTKNSVETVIKHSARTGPKPTIENIKKESRLRARNLPKDEIKNLTKPQIIRNETMARRQLFDILDLPEEFRARDYKEAIEEKGAKITNDAMPYDDLKWLEKQGRIVSLDKRGNSPHVYKLTQKKGVESDREEFINVSAQ